MRCDFAICDNSTGWPDETERARRKERAQALRELLKEAAKTELPNGNRITEKMLRDLRDKDRDWTRHAEHLEFFAEITDSSSVRALEGANKDRFLDLIEAELNRVLSETPTTEGVST